MKLRPLRILRAVANATANVLGSIADALDYFVPQPPPPRRYTPDTRPIAETLRADARAVEADGARSRGRVIHYDVGDRTGPIAFCSELLIGKVCTEEWLDVTCPACFALRAPEKAPFSRRERMLRRRATGPGTSRPISNEELNEESAAMRSIDPHGKYWPR